MSAHKIGDKVKCSHAWYAILGVRTVTATRSWFGRTRISLDGVHRNCQSLWFSSEGFSKVGDGK